MQHIGIRIETEQGQIIKDYSLELNLVDIIKLITQENSLEYETLKNQYPLITSIDPYGTTYFNYLQINNLLIELSKISALTSKNTVLENFIKCLSEADIQKRRLLVKFIGD